MTNQNNTLNLDNETLRTLSQMISSNISIDAVPHYSGKNILLTDYMQQWLDTKKAISITEKTYENYEGRYRNHIKPFFRGMTLTDITIQTVIAFVKTLTTKSITASTVHDIVRVLSIALNDAVTLYDYIPKNPCKGAPLPKIRTKKMRPAITDDEILALYDVCKKHHYWIVVPLLAQTGMRKGELLALTWEDIIHNEVTDTWHIRITKSVSSSKKEHVNDYTKTPEGCRNIAINKDLAHMLMWYKENTQKNERSYIVAQKRQDKREGYRNFGRTLKRWVKKANIRTIISAHSFRHAFATRLIIEHADRDAIKRQGGWRDDRMPDYYADDAQTEILKNECANIMSAHWEGKFAIA